MQEQNSVDYPLNRFPDSPDDYPSLYVKSYVLTENGISYMVGEGDKARNIVVCPHPITPIQTLKNIDTGTEKIKIGFNRHGYWEEIIIDRSKIASSSKIIEIADSGIIVNSESAKHLMMYINNLESVNRNNLPIKKSIGRLGWIPKYGFSPYDSEMVFDGHDQFRQIFESISECGSYELWLNQIKKIRSNGVTARILLASSFASILIEPLKKLPFVVHLWGGTEAGKTVGLLMAASIWGNPNEGHLLRNFNSTTVGLELLATVCNSIPLCVNELQITKENNMDTQIYQLCEGTGRTRGNKTLGISKTGTWHNCILTNGEQPITHGSSGGGAVNRTIEIECKQPLFENPVETSNIMRENYGFLGRKWVEFVRDNAEEIQAKYNHFYGLITKSDTTDKQAMAAALIVTADYFATKLFFTDGKNLQTGELINFLSSKSQVSAQERAYEYLCGWVSSNNSKFESVEVGETYGKYQSESKNLVYIISSRFEKALKDQGYHSKPVLSWLHEKGLIESNIAGHKYNTRVNGPVVSCVALKLNQFEPTDCEHPFD